MVEHVLDHVQLGLWSFEPWMREIEDNSIKPSVLQFSVKLHCFYIDAMQNRGPQSFQLHYIWLCVSVLDRQSNCKRGLPQHVAMKLDSCSNKTIKMFYVCTGYSQKLTHTSSVPLNVNTSLMILVSQTLETCWCFKRLTFLTILKSY